MFAILCLDEMLIRLMKRLTKTVIANPAVTMQLCVCVRVCPWKSCEVVNSISPQASHPNHPNFHFHMVGVGIRDAISWIGDSHRCLPQSLTLACFPRSQTSDIWTDAATAVSRVGEEKDSEKREWVSKRAKRQKSRDPLCFSNVSWLRRADK